jgi:hypothetical protein
MSVIEFHKTNVSSGRQNKSEMKRKIIVNEYQNMENFQKANFKS